MPFRALQSFLTVADAIASRLRARAAMAADAGGESLDLTPDKLWSREDQAAAESFASARILVEPTTPTFRALVSSADELNYRHQLWAKLARQARERQADDGSPELTTMNPEDIFDPKDRLALEAYEGARAAVLGQVPLPMEDAHA